MSSVVICPYLSLSDDTGVSQISSVQFVVVGKTIILNADVVTDKEDPGQLNRGLLIVAIETNSATRKRHVWTRVAHGLTAEYRKVS